SSLRGLQRRTPCVARSMTTDRGCPTPTPPLALFIALGGTSYAVGGLPANSVGSKQLRMHAAMRSKIRAAQSGPPLLRGHPRQLPRSRAIEEVDASDVSRRAQIGQLEHSPNRPGA